MEHSDFIALIAYLGCPNHHTHGEDLVFCSHSDNPCSTEGNCNFDLCPLKDTFSEAKKDLDNFDPFFREEDYE